MRWYIGLVILAVLVIGGVWFAEKYNYEQMPGPAAKPTVVLIRPGTSVAEIGGQLKAANVIADDRLFAIALRLRARAGQLKAGEYEFPAHATMAQVASIMVEGKSLQHKLTIAEGRSRPHRRSWPGS
jgi:UPF0755 protein